MGPELQVLETGCAQVVLYSIPALVLGKGL